MNAVKYYVQSKIELTNCMQKHFRQLCSRCTEYARCKVYSKYVDAWIRLQELARQEEEPNGSNDDKK